MGHLHYTSPCSGTKLDSSFYFCSCLNISIIKKLFQSSSVSTKTLRAVKIETKSRRGGCQGLRGDAGELVFNGDAVSVL